MYRSQDAFEKRVFKRITRKYIMRVAADNGDPWPRWSLVTAHDLSAGGAMFTVDHPIKKEGRLIIKLNFLERVIDCAGRVTRLAPGFQKPLVNAAVKFEGLTEDDQKYIENYARKYT